MADKKISALTSLAQGDVAASTDVLPIVDTSATETKKITASALVGAGMTAGVTNVDINSGSIDGTTIGANSAAAGTFTNLTASGTVSFSGATVSNGGAVTTIDINGGTIDATSIGASSASTGAFTTLTTSSTVTLNGGTANGVLYLNGSKVATSGSALVFDGTNLGIGVSPSYRLDILASGSAAGLRINNASAGKSAMLLQTNGTTAGIIALTGFIQGDSTTNFGFFAETGNDIRLYTNGSPTPKAVLDTSGNLGLGVTPSTSWFSSSKAIQIGSAGAPYMGLAQQTTTTCDGYMLWGARLSGDRAFQYTTTGDAVCAYRQNAGTHNWFTAASGTAGNTISFTQAMTLDSSGRLGIGTTSPDSMAEVNSSTAAYARFKVNYNGSALAYLGSFSGIVGSGNATDTMLASTGVLAFGAGGTSERARITSGGYFKASDNGSYDSSTGAYHEFYQTANNSALFVRATNASYASNALGVAVDRNTTNNSFYAFSYYNNGAAAYKLRVADSGDVTNTNGTYGQISDAKMKTDIVDASSQWSDIKGLRFRKFKMKNDPSGLTQLGVVAQEVEQVSPGLVDEHVDRDAEGNDLGTTTKSVKTSVLLMKAAVALQEAMARIEKLEAEMALLKGA